MFLQFLASLSSNGTSLSAAEFSELVYLTWIVEKFTHFYQLLFVSSDRRAVDIHSAPTRYRPVRPFRKGKVSQDNLRFDRIFKAIHSISIGTDTNDVTDSILDDKYNII